MSKCSQCNVNCRPSGDISTKTSRSVSLAGSFDGWVRALKVSSMTFYVIFAADYLNGFVLTTFLSFRSVCPPPLPSAPRAHTETLTGFRISKDAVLNEKFDTVQNINTCSNYTHLQFSLGLYVFIYSVYFLILPHFFIHSIVSQLFLLHACTYARTHINLLINIFLFYFEWKLATTITVRLIQDVWRECHLFNDYDYY